MINSIELRIGNYVQDEHGIVQYVYRLWQGGAELTADDSGVNDIDYTNEEMFGVPLTKKWLLNSVFEEDSDGMFTLTIGRKSFPISLE